MEGLPEDIVGRLGGVEDIKPGGFLFCNFKIRHADLLMEGNIFFFDPVFGALDPFESLMGIDVEIEGDVRLEVIGCKMAELADPCRIKSPRAALISDSRVVKAVAKDYLAIFQGRQDHLLDMLGPVSQEKKELAAGRDIFFIMMKQEVPDELAGHGAAGGSR